MPTAPQNPSPENDASAPSMLGGVSPDELFARGMQSVRMTVGAACRIGSRPRWRKRRGCFRIIRWWTCWDGAAWARLQGRANRAGSHGGDQAAAARDQHRPGFCRSFCARSADDGETEPPEHRLGIRLRHHDGGASLFRHGVRRGDDAAPFDQVDRAQAEPGPGTDREHLRGVAIRARGRRGASRHQAGQRAGGHEGPGEGGRLRPRAHGFADHRAMGPDDDGHGAWYTGLHGAGAEERLARGSSRGHLQPRRDAL